MTPDQVDAVIDELCQSMGPNNVAAWPVALWHNTIMHAAPADLPVALEAASMMRPADPIDRFSLRCDVVRKVRAEAAEAERERMKRRVKRASTDEVGRALNEARRFLSRAS